MYGTVARLRVKPGMEQRLAEYGQRIEPSAIPGQVATYIYQMDRDSREFMLVAVFESKEAYVANANSPEQNERFMEMMELLDGEPQWNDGQVIFQS